MWFVSLRLPKVAASLLHAVILWAEIRETDYSSECFTLLVLARSICYLHIVNVSYQSKFSCLANTVIISEVYMRVCIRCPAAPRQVNTLPSYHCNPVRTRCPHVRQHVGSNQLRQVGLQGPLLQFLIKLHLRNASICASEGDLWEQKDKGRERRRLFSPVVSPYGVHGHKHYTYGKCLLPTRKTGRETFR